MRDLLTFLYAGSTAMDGIHGPSEWSRWLKQAIRSVEPAAYIQVDIRIYDDAKIDQLERQYRDDPKKFKEQSDDSDRQALVEDGRVERGTFEDVSRPAMWAQ